jgi:hypothetical protein
MSKTSNYLKWKTASGSLVAQTNEHSYRIDYSPGFWRLSTGKNGSRSSMQSVWISDDREECRRMADFIASHLAAEKEWEARSVPRIERPTHVPGVTVKGRKGGAIVVELSENGQKVGQLYALLTPWQATFVVGEMTINCAPIIYRDDLKHIGLGRVMHDVAEELANLPLIPHGRNMAPGSSSADNQRFWAKRAQHRRVPGIDDPEATKRLGVIEQINEYTGMEDMHYHSSTFAIAAAARTGWRIEAAFGDPARQTGPFGMPEGPPGHEILGAWCVMPDGSAFSSKGREMKSAFLSRWTDPEVSIVTASSLQDGELARFARCSQGNEVVAASRLAEEMEEAEKVAQHVLARHHVEVSPVLGTAGASEESRTDPSLEAETFGSR